MTLGISTKGLGASATSGTNGALKRAASGNDGLKRRFKAADLRSKLAQIKADVALGKPDLQIADELGVSANAYNHLKKELQRQETAALYNQSTEDVYLEYVWRQNKCVEDLQDMINDFQATKQYNAIVGAVRAKSDIIDRILKTGQDMGILEKAPERKMILHGVAIANMDNSNLRKLIAEELEGLAAIVSKYGDRNLMGDAIDVGDSSEAKSPLDVLSIELPPPPVFSAKGKPKQGAGGLAKAAAGRKRHMKRTKGVAPPQDSR